MRLHYERASLSLQYKFPSSLIIFFSLLNRNIPNRSLGNLQNQTKSKTESYIHADDLEVTFLAVGVCKCYQIHVYVMTTDRWKSEAILSHILTHFLLLE